jgi:glycosyltransferase involved in cell wall biosynthesis
MNILICCNQIPYPLKDGYSYACLNLAKSLKHQNCSVDIFAYNTTKKMIDINIIPDPLKKSFNWHTPLLDNKLKIWDALWCLIKNKSYHVARFDAEHLKKDLSVLLKKKDYHIIQMEGLYLSPLIETCRKHSKAKIILRAHNIEHIIWERLMSNEKNLFKKSYLKVLTNQLKTYELSVLNKIDAILPISKIDLIFFKSRSIETPLTYIPFGIEIEKNIQNKAELNFFFIGSLDWQPNLVGLIWFLDHVWSKFKRLHPNIVFKIAGKNTPVDLYKYQDEQTLILGEVESAHNFIEENGTMVVPLFSGSGIRVKIIEAMAQRKCILSTPIGAEGLYENKDEHILIASKPEDFILKMESLISKPEIISNVGNKAYEYVLKNHELSKTGKQLKDFYESITS